MDNKNQLFPYQFQELFPHETAKVQKHLTGIIKNFARVGPKGYLCPIAYKEHAATIYNMPLRPSDVVVASYQRSGTTWTQELVWLVAKDLDYEQANKIPLTQRYPFLEMTMFLDEDAKNVMRQGTAGDAEASKMMEAFLQPACEVLATTASPRFIKTHLPLSLLPPQLVDATKVVYVARDPRDVAVSCYHHAKLFQFMGFEGDFKDFWNLFIQDLYVMTPYFAHVQESWDKRNHANMLFLFYEELKKDLPATVRRVANFLDKQLTEEQISKLCVHLSFDNFKNNKSVNFEDLRMTGTLASGESFVRQGKAGGWRDYFDKEMELQAERWMADNLKGTDLRFPH